MVGATSFKDTVVLQPLGKCTNAQLCLQTGHFLLVQTCCFKNTGPGKLNQVGTEVPKVELCLWTKKRMWGDSFVAVHNSDMTEW